MRVISGRLKGMTLSSPSSNTTRPTSDRLREAIFSMLFSYIELEDAYVADLYAGTGALGIEAFSRGAQHVVFIETDKDAYQAIQKNIEQVKTRVNIGAGTFELHRTPVLSFVKGEQKYGSYDVVFADPPYDYDVEVEVLNIIARGGFLIYETSAQNLDKCKKILSSHKLVKGIIVSRAMGSSGVIIAEVV